MPQVGRPTFVMPGIVICCRNWGTLDLGNMCGCPLHMTGSRCQSAACSPAGGRVVAQLASVDVRADAKLPDMQQWLEQHQLPFRRRLLQQGSYLF
jgi:hypothetical protein